MIYMRYKEELINYGEGVGLYKHAVIHTLFSKCKLHWRVIYFFVLNKYQNFRAPAYTTLLILNGLQVLSLPQAPGFF